MKEAVTFQVYLLDLLGVALGKDQVARATVGALHGCFAVGRHVLAVMATETTVPVFVPNVIGMGSPICLHLGEEILVIDFFRDPN
ncbi:MAG TPA: hypothetical protein VE086_03425, partial [Chthoniobacterales bacterium]|nr:hypothetical protein [Chthoniobacterales bacterium]